MNLTGSVRPWIVTLMLGAVLSCPGCSGMNGGGGGDNNNANGNGNDNANGNTNGNDNGNTNDNGGGIAPGNLVLTEHRTHVDGRVASGDDLIVYTGIDPDGTPGVVTYLVPSAGTDPMPVPDGEQYDNDSFAVAGKKIALAGGPDNTFQVSIFDTVSGETRSIPTTDIRLINIPVGPYEAGHIQADGDLVITRNDPGFDEVLDGFVVKAIDISGDEPRVIPFSNNPADSDFGVNMVLIDAETRLAVAVRQGVFYVYDVDNPEVPPLEFDFSQNGGIDDDAQFAFDNGVILYSDDDQHTAYLLDVTTASNTPVMLATPSTNSNARYALRDDAYGYFFAGAASSGNASAVGRTDDTTPLLGDIDDTILENSANFGRFGYGDSLALALNNGGPLWVLGGSRAVGTPDAMQFSTGGSWMLIGDPTDPDSHLRATDVESNASGNLVTFKYGLDTTTQVGYLPLN